MLRHILSTLLLGTAVTLAHAGEGYQQISPPVNTSSNAGQVEVLEYFWFGCPHCFAFEPTIIKWVENKPAHVDFVREAPPLNPGWMVHSQAFYAAEIMGVTDIIFKPMFDAIHIQKKRLRNPKAIADFVSGLGVDRDKFLQTMKSFAVQTRIKQAMIKARASGITGVPSIVINGKYLTGNSLAGGHDGIVRVMNELVESEFQTTR